MYAPTRGDSLQMARGVRGKKNSFDIYIPYLTHFLQNFRLFYKVLKYESSHYTNEVAGNFYSSAATTKV